MRLGEGALTGGVGYAAFQALLAWVALGVLMRIATTDQPPGDDPVTELSGPRASRLPV
jgi:hypothetical protein